MTNDQTSTEGAPKRLETSGLVFVLPDPKPVDDAKRAKKHEHLKDILTDAVTSLVTIGILSLIYGGTVLYSIWKVGRDGD